MSKRYDVLTLHPDLVQPYLNGSIMGRAATSGAVKFGVHNIRDWSENKHRTVDATPYGGGAGMVMRVDVVARAIEAVQGEGGRVILMAPSGTPFSQAEAVRLSAQEHLVFVCGHYEGIDARIESLVDETLSLGDFVLTGGEIAAVAMIDAIARLQPGVLGNDSSALDESFSDGLLEYPHYTRPREWRGQDVPEVLLSGHHQRIEDWRRNQAIERTRRIRPDLLEKTVDEKLHND